MEEPKIQLSEWQKVQLEMSPESDFPLTDCRFKFLVCSTQRSGSWLLCSGLASTGRAGLPAEYFSPTYVKAYEERIGRPSPTKSEYWKFLLRRRSSPNGVFGAKMHFNQMRWFLQKKETQRAFLAGFDRLIFLSRRNKLAQAVSYWRANATQVFRVATDESREQPTAPQVDYNFSNIAEALHRITAQEANWRSLLSEFREKTLSLTYEELATDYLQTMRRVLVALELEAAVPTLIPYPQVSVQRDQTNYDWEQRFMNDLFGRNALDSN